MQSFSFSGQLESPQTLSVHEQLMKENCVLSSTRSTTEPVMSSRHRVCTTPNKTASLTSACSWWQAAALLAGLFFVMGEACQQGHFMNTTSGDCQKCTNCGAERLQPISDCNDTADAVCAPCPDPMEYYASALERCTFDCLLCPHNKGCLKGREGQCDCSFDPTGCTFGVLCDQRQPECNTETSPTTATTVSSGTTHEPSNQLAIPHWGIALVSIGVIVGIVLFSALFVLLGLATSRRRGRHDDYNSSSSSSNTSMKSISLMDRFSYSPGGGTSSSLMSLYTQTNSPTFQNYQLSLSALKHGSHSNLGSSSSSFVKGSPKTQRTGSIPLTITHKSRDGYLTPV